MRESWSDFEKYVFDRLEQNHAEHTDIQMRITVLEERTRKPAKKKIVNWKIGLGALVVAVVAAAKEWCK